MSKQTAPAPARHVPNGHTGLVPVWLHVPAEREEEFNAWYEREHVAEVVSLPGFRSGRRYVAEGVKPKFLCLYETRDAGVAEEPPFQHLVTHPTPWSSRIWEFFEVRQRRNWRRHEVRHFLLSDVPGAVLMREWRGAPAAPAGAAAEPGDAGVLAYRLFRDEGDPAQWIELIDFTDARAASAAAGAAAVRQLSRAPAGAPLQAQCYVATGVPRFQVEGELVTAAGAPAAGAPAAEASSGT